MTSPYKPAPSDPSASSDPMTSPHKSASSDPMTSSYKPASSDPSASPDPSASSDPMTSPDPSASSDPMTSPDKSASPDPSASSDPMTSPDPSASPYKPTSSDPSASPDKSAPSDPMTSPYSAPMASPDKSPSSNPVASVTAPLAPLHLLLPAVQLLAKTQELLVELVLVCHLHVVAPVARGYGPPVAAVAVVAVVDPSLARVVVPPSPVDVPAPPVVSPATMEANEEEIVRFILGLIKFGSCCIN